MFNLSWFYTVIIVLIFLAAIWVLRRIVVAIRSAGRKNQPKEWDATVRENYAAGRREREKPARPEASRPTTDD
jgi:hypothetical protein